MVSAEISDAELMAVARSMLTKAYVRWSKFPVGAAVLTAAGGVYPGCNVENASFGLTICGERSAIFRAVAEEGPDMKIVAIAVASDAVTCPPCGACRQVIAEFGGTARVLFPKDNSIVSMQLEETLPVRFEL
jgi:cytidine deaminase